MADLSKSALKALNRLKNLEGAVKERTNIWAPQNIIQSSSPGVNWLFGKGYGFPRGYSMLLWGKPKAGKSFLSFDFAGQFMKTNPNGIVMKFDTERRDEGQLDEQTAANFGIDLERWICYQGNRPDGVFDRIKSEVPAAIQEGLDVGLIIVDSITGIMGRRECEQTTVMQHQIGDHAVTLQVGLKSILDIQRNNRIGLILTAHASAELDIWKAKKNPTKASAAFGTQHHTEFWVNVERNETKTGNQNELEEKFLDESKKGFDDQGESTGHRIRVWMQDSSLGPKNRVAEFTLDYKRGIVNQHEELYKLGIRWGIIQRPTNRTYQIGENKFDGKPACLEAIAKSPELQKQIMVALQSLENTNSILEQSDDAAQAEFEAPES